MDKNNIKKHAVSAILTIGSLFLTALAGKLAGIDPLTASGSVDWAGILTIIRLAAKASVENYLHEKFGVI